jgi:hypothetical protein
VTEERANLAATGSVMLDIGEDVGALVVHVDSPLLGHEVEARSATENGRAIHADVLERRTAHGPQYAAVIPALLAGRYTVWLDGTLRCGDVEVSAGRVTELDRR